MVRLMVSGWPISDKWQRTCGILQISWYQHTIENLYGLWKIIEKKNLSTPKKSISKGKLLDNWLQTKAINKWMAKSNLYVAPLSTCLSSFFILSICRAQRIILEKLLHLKRKQIIEKLGSLHLQSAQHQEEQAFAFAIYKRTNAWCALHIEQTHWINEVNKAHRCTRPTHRGDQMHKILTETKQPPGHRWSAPCSERQSCRNEQERWKRARVKAK